MFLGKSKTKRTAGAKMATNIAALNEWVRKNEPTKIDVETKKGTFEKRSFSRYR